MKTATTSLYLEMKQSASPVFIKSAIFAKVFVGWTGGSYFTVASRVIKGGVFFVSRWARDCLLS
jgi:hypothetical protein